MDFSMLNQRNTFIHLSEDQRFEIKLIAESEKRTMKAQTEVLIQEALAARRESEAKNG